MHGVIPPGSSAARRKSTVRVAANRARLKERGGATKSVQLSAKSVLALQVIMASGPTAQTDAIAQAVEQEALRLCPDEASTQALVLRGALSAEEAQRWTVLLAE
ncbi:hypothetical protein ACSFA0_25995 [Variovorax sp. LT1P1]|uniref:hypothetical protein n=1 Tax=Variovorax sp. LT1P1 TaxID=3443730 RepID=UPI003F486B5A